MQNNPYNQNQNKTSSFIKKIIILIILLIIGIGIFFGFKFYNASKQGKTANTGPKTTNTNPNRTPFQTRTSSSTDTVKITGDLNKKQVENPIASKKEDKIEPKLIQLWKEPVSGFDFIKKDIEIVDINANKTSTSTNSTTTKNSTSTENFKKTIFKNEEFVHFWDRASGHIYENIASSSKVNRISNKTTVAAQEAYFIDKENILIRKIENDNGYITDKFISLFKDNATSTLFDIKEKSLYLPTDNISVSNKDKKIFFFKRNSGEGFITNIDGSGVKSIINTSIRDILPQYVNKNKVAINTKPSAYFEGYLFFINPENKTNEYILGEKYGFTTLISPDGNKVLYNEIVDNVLQTSIYDIKNKETVTLSQSTLIEKCTWSKDSLKIYCAIPYILAQLPYPDIWYQGKTDFSDNIWSIDANTGVFNLKIALQDQVSESIDAYNIKLSENEDYLIFQDKYTLSLWKYTF